MKKVITLMIVALTTLLGANALMIWGNPEVSFWRKYMEKNSARLESIRAEKAGEPVILITGGSSCSFSIDPLVVEGEMGMPVCNMGGSASMGASYLIARTLLQAKEGDVVVLAIEPGLLSKFLELESIPLALEMAAGEGRPTLAVGQPVLDRDFNATDFVSTLRPGSRYSSTMVSKLVTGQELYRYRMQDWQEGGRLSTDYKDSLLKPDGKMANAFPISSTGVEILRDAADYCEEHGIRLCYVLPWIYTEETAVEGNRLFNTQFLDQVENTLPVLRDSHIGVCSDRQLYADTIYHLSDDGSKIRSKELAASLKKWFRALRES